MRVYLTGFLTVCVFLAIDAEGPYCFNFTWPGPTVSHLDCEEHNKDNPYTPCIKPFFNRTKPDLDKIWKNEMIWKNETYIQLMESVCIKYTYTYNGAVKNISYFHGRVTEDQTKPVTKDCYVKYTEGYTIEVCVCESKSNAKPCNSTIRNTYSLFIIFATATVSLFMYKIFEIP